MSPDEPPLDVVAALASTRKDEVVVALQSLVARPRALDARLGAILVQLLGSPAKEIARRAAEVLQVSAAEPLASSLLTDALEDVDARRRWGAAFALARAGRCDTTVVRVAIDSMSLVDGDVRWAAAEIVREAAGRVPQAVDWLRVAAMGESAQGRKMALYCLRDVDRDEHDAFVAALDDRDREVRLAGLSGLCERDGDRAGRTIDRVVALIRGDEDAGVRRSAAATLGRMLRSSAAGDSEAGRLAVAVLETLADDASDPHLQRAARRALRTVAAQEERPQ